MQHTTEETTGIYVSLSELLRFGYMPMPFNIRPTAPVASQLSGRNRSAMRGRGMDFSELKHYVQGDDTRNMDWKATRRTGKPYIRVYNEERDRNVWLLVSQMNSMFFGSTERMKSVSAAHTAALAAFKTLQAGDRVGAVVYNNDEVKFFKATASKKGVVQILTEVERQNRLLKATNVNNSPKTLNEALKIVSSLAKHDDLVLMIGDGRALDAETRRHVTRISAHNDVMAVLVYDPMEEQIVESPSLFFSDGVETVDVDSTSGSFKKKFDQRLELRKEQMQHLSRKNAIPVLSISTAEPVADQLYRQLNMQGAR
ncbi:DUF58 domain-containing protein [Sulfurovum sp. NBC37-1]|uniref:DUF58 domain-containing protein n=1 Tax=Sulfurovum sp. (strain NBC37-1) TaxID=387093 RepID=UPI0001587AB5|nr:DUF58 domain-containing protein [Sulfurovum sp. NBC37-1]BAF73323.1 conserved hypothetical protein [Sulfurovum sp. NBC37-1]